jgi:hypothetical protein
MNYYQRHFMRIPPAAAALCSLGGGVRIWP